MLVLKVKKHPIRYVLKNIGRKNKVSALVPCEGRDYGYF